MTRRFEGGTYVKNSHRRKGPYIRISAGPLRGMYVHVLVMEAKLGRKLRGSETVDHIDGDGLNCSPDNLQVVTRPENTRLMNKRLREQRERAAPYLIEAFRDASD